MPGGPFFNCYPGPFSNVRCIIGKSLSSLYRGIKAPNDPIPSYKRGKLLYFYEDELYAWIESGRKHSVAPSLAETAAAITAGMKRRPRGGYNF
jgi:hypothetical protein